MAFFSRLSCCPLFCHHSQIISGVAFSSSLGRKYFRGVAPKLPSSFLLFPSELIMMSLAPIWIRQWKVLWSEQVKIWSEQLPLTRMYYSIDRHHLAVGATRFESKSPSMNELTETVIVADGVWLTVEIKESRNIPCLESFCYWRRWDVGWWWWFFHGNMTSLHSLEKIPRFGAFCEILLAVGPPAWVWVAEALDDSESHAQRDHKAE